MLRGVLGTASWRAQQMSPQFAADVSLLFSASAQPVVQDLLDGPRHASQCCTGSSRSLFLQVSESGLRLVVACGAFGQPTAFPCGHRCTVGIDWDPPMCLDAQGGIKANLGGLGRCRRDVLS